MISKFSKFNQIFLFYFLFEILCNWKLKTLVMLRKFIYTDIKLVICVSFDF